MESTAGISRTAGILLHPSSLPGATFGASARQFVDWLARAGTTWWQILPLAPPDGFRSPYASPSAFAIDPALIDDPEAPVSDSEARAFRDRNAVWIDSHMARFGGSSLGEQVRAEREWSALRAYAARRGVRVLGDLPIYVADGGVEHTARPELFLDGLVGGVPPDLFTDDGQRWGNPVYDWDAHAREGYTWWIARLRRAAALADRVRLDHFRGFAAFWAVPRDAPTARDGHRRQGPGRGLFDAAGRALGGLPFIAEDLGIITQDVDALREGIGLPGMRVAQFAFDGNPENPHLPANTPEGSVAYTGTHDNATLVSWFESLGDDVRSQVDAVARDHGSWGILAAVLASRAEIAILPMQDILGLGARGRMNTPGTTGGNWQWRLPSDALDPELADCLAALVSATRRSQPHGVSGA